MNFSLQLPKVNNPTFTIDAPTSLRFVDFSLRAWREGPYLQVIAHSTPAGGMRQPIAVKLGAFNQDNYRLPLLASLAQGAEVGRQLTRLLLPDNVWRLLCESLRIIAPQKALGLRLRICLDDDLIDLPWELLYRPDIEAPEARSGFLLLDGRISLVREPPSLVAAQQETNRTQHGLFVGALFDNGSDTWSVAIEHASLTKSMRPLKSLITFDFVRADRTEEVDQALAAGCDLFHYAGHTEMEEGRGTIVQLASSELYAQNKQLADMSRVETLPTRAAWAWGDMLALRLSRARTKLAVFNACNSGFWPFVRPFMRAGLPAVIGVQGLVSNIAALNFAEKLYQSLAVGLSLDEALTFARLCVVEPERSYYDCDWARFMAYMPTESAVLFPRSEESALRRRQQSVRTQRAEAIEGLSKRLDGEGVSRMLSDIAARSVLILGRFTTKRKAILDAIQKSLAMPSRQYVPIVFDFEKPDHLTLIGSILRFASVSRLVIADLSDPKSVPAELQAIVPQFVSLPVILIIEATQREYPVSDDILSRQSVMPVVRYRDEAHLMSILDAEILVPAEELYTKLNPRTMG